jgi:hypothetical protein
VRKEQYFPLAIDDNPQHQALRGPLMRPLFSRNADDRLLLQAIRLNLLEIRPALSFEMLRLRQLHPVIATMFFRYYLVHLTMTCRAIL